MKTVLNKVPQVTALFWIIKIAATTLGETGGDAVSMSMGLGYLYSTFIFAGLFFIAVAIQMKSTEYHPYIYWLTIIATTTVGTTLADFATRSMGIGYMGGSLLLSVLLMSSLLIWFVSLGSISAASIHGSKAEAFYWLTIMFSQTLGTAWGDWVADNPALGYGGSTVIFGGLLLLVLLAYFYTSISRVILFWCAFILTRPLGAVVGDLLDKPIEDGGLALSRYGASWLLILFIAMTLVIARKLNPQVLKE